MPASAQQNIIPVGLLMVSRTLEDSAEKKMVARWLEEYTAYRERKGRPQVILQAVFDGYDLLPEIVSQTGIPQTSARRILKEFVNRKKIRGVKVKNHNRHIELRYELV